MLSENKQSQWKVQQGKNRETLIQIKSEDDDELMEKIKLRSNQIKKAIKDNKQIENQITDYQQYEADFYKTKKFEDVPEDLLPNMILVFNSKRRVIKMPGFPSLHKEIAEIIECGQLDHSFRAMEYIKAIERYASVEQRWGL